ncbi:hypothetical protein MLD38_031167 [Melastoma candidum]|uniref:Uncharacterized protein n=1 Tax=Melastoma candidum TaxID=119954 RepID=A0ACB9MSE1_9MYRT|nr:hypothetical protein MLD38_031167 [Melastoma candidum]
MHRCGVGSCSCCSTGIFGTATHHTPPSNFSVLFSVPSHHKLPLPSFDEPFDLDLNHSHHHHSSSVDCTLSLGTPSTRSAAGYELERRSSGGSCMPNFCWDLFQNPKQYSSSPANAIGNGSTGFGSGNSFAAGNDSLLARRCANCDTTSTPLWRNGPRGPKSLCNACGIRFKKEERRAAAASAGNGSGQPPASVPHVFSPHNSWINSHATMQSHKMPSCFSTAATGNEFRFVDDDDGGAGRDSEISFLSWRLNMADRPGLVNDFTR